MDITTILGLGIGFGLIIIAIGVASLPVFISVPSILIVIGGTLSAVMVNYPLKDILEGFAVAKNTLRYKTQSPTELIPMLVNFASQARRDGILVLQNATASIDDPFLGKGIQLAIDGMEPQTISKILEIEVEHIRERHKVGAELFMTLGTFAPAFGMIGTLIGLVLMLQQMDDPSAIGPAMALALITTFYGALMANLVFLPMAGKLKKRSQDEILVKELTLEGIISIAGGDNPRVIEQKLHAFLKPKHRESSFK